MELQKKTREIEALRSEKLGVVEAESVKARELHDAQRNQEKTAKELQALIQQSAEQQKQIAELERQKEEQRQSLQREFDAKIAEALTKSSAAQADKE